MSPWPKLVTACLAAVAGLACGGGDEEQSPRPASSQRLVLMGLDSIGRARSVDLDGRENWEGRLRGFGCGDAPFQMVRADDRLVYCAGFGKTMSIAPDLTGDPERIGRGGEYFLPAGDGTIWLIGPPHHRPGRLRDGGNQRRIVRRVDLAGEVLDKGTVKTGCFPVVAVVAGPLCQERARGLGLIDIRTGEIGMHFAGTFPTADADTIAACNEPCPTLFVSEVPTGETLEVKAPAPLRFAPGYEGAISPDGSKLATTVFLGPPDESRQFPRQNRPEGLAIVDLANGDVELIDDRIHLYYGLVDWSADSRRVYFPGDARGEVDVYDLSSQSKTGVPLHLNDEIFQMAAF